MSKVIHTDSDHLLDSGEELWPAREPPSRQEQAVLASIKKLTPRQREIVEGVYYERLSYGDLADRLGISRQSVQVTHRRALKTMRKRINETLATTD